MSGMVEIDNILTVQSLYMWHENTLIEQSLQY